MPTVERTPEGIIEAVERHEQETDALRTRQDADYSLFRLDGYDAGDDYESYTSNEPRTYADKIVSWLSSAELTVRIPVAQHQKEKREINDKKERFILGVMRAADDHLRRMLQLPFQDQVGWHIAMRGWYAGRALLVREEDENGISTTHIDITPFDPRHTFWGVGARGIDWVCHRTRLTRVDIKAQYDVDVGAGDVVTDESGIDVYDFYDSETNIVVIESQVLKEATPHGADRVPCFLGPVPTGPLILTEQLTDTSAGYGESIYASARDIYGNHNKIMSTMLELVERARKQGVKVFSRDGTKTLDEDPYKAGTELALSTGNEDVVPLGMLEIAKETGAFMGLVSGELQRATLPHSAFGELQFQLSGFAITQLRQGIETVLQPRVKAMERCYKDISELLTEQYSSGLYDEMELSGQDQNHEYFSERMDPFEIQQGGDPEIRFLVQLPEDDAGKVAQAQMLREGPVPLLPDLYIRDRILGLQDADNIDATIKEQLGERMLPEASLFVLMKALEERGRDDLAQFYMGQLMEVTVQKQMQRAQLSMAMQQAGIPGQPGGAPGQQGGVPGQQGVGVSNGALPQAAQGVPPPTPLGGPGSAGPQVAPGTPRPGAAAGSDEARLNALGLVGPRG
jgi:hypothetical protein